MKGFRRVWLIRDQRGAVGIIVAAFLLLAGIGFAAFAIDFGHLHVVRNELQNAADAGALAGARVLLGSDRIINTTLASSTAQAAATANTSGKDETGPLPVECVWDGGNGPDVIRGHWSFANGFEANPSDTQGDLFDSPDLDTDPSFINAVKVVTRRTSIPSFFAKIFGYDSFQRTAEAVAYLGFPGEFAAHAFDQPIAICQDSIKDPDTEKLTCNIGRMLNSGNDPHTSNTGGWTNFSQPCATANAPSIRPLVCAGGNPNPVSGGGVGATGGVVDNIFRDLRDCWLAGKNAIEWDEDHNPIDWESVDQWGSDGVPDGVPDRPWHLRLPVVDCSEQNNVGNCPTLVGAVKLSVIWIVRDQNETPQDPAPVVPDRMYHPGKDQWWTNTFSDDETAWSGTEEQDGFAKFFDLKNQDGSPAPLQNKAIYFMPSCEDSPPMDGPGGEFFGVVSEWPVLVQ